MSQKYEEWHQEVSHDVKKGVLMTMSHICKRREKDEMDYYTSQQLDDLKDCMSILAMMHHHHHGGGHNMPPAAAVRVSP